MESLLLDAAISHTKFDNAGYRQKIVVVLLLLLYYFCC